MRVISKSVEIDGKTLSFETGKIAKQVFDAMWHGEGSADAIIDSFLRLDGLSQGRLYAAIGSDLWLLEGDRLDFESSLNTHVTGTRSIPVKCVLF